MNRVQFNYFYQQLTPNSLRRPISTSVLWYVSAATSPLKQKFISSTTAVDGTLYTPIPLYRSTNVGSTPVCLYSSILDGDKSKIYLNDLFA